jgi:hypothetical protein
MSREKGVIAFRQTIGPLTIAPLAAVAMLTWVTLRQAGSNWLIIAPYLALRIAPLCYGAAVLFVLPILAVWPALRRPSYLVASIWGILSAWAATVLLAAFLGVSFRFRQVLRWESLLGLLAYGAIGAASGLFYASLVRQRSHRET